VIGSRPDEVGSGGVADPAPATPSLRARSARRTSRNRASDSPRPRPACR
jgi:hypothetical protein